MEPKDNCILMDVDGVLLDLFPAVKEYVLAKYNRHITPNMITCWDWDYCLGVPLICNEFWDYVWNTELPHYTQAVQFITTLKNLNYTVYAVSQRTSEAAKLNARKQFPKLGFDAWVLCNNKLDKVKYATMLGATWALEDNPKTAAALGAEVDNMKSYLLTRPWNQQCLSIDDSYKRIHSYKDFLNVVMAHSGWGL
jgi:hypothetical protein